MSFTREQYTEQMLKLLPPGKAFSKDKDSNIYKMFNAFAGQIKQVDDTAEDLIEDWFPSTTTNFLEEWQNSLGLPDGCIGNSGSLDDQRNQVVARLTFTGETTKSFIEQYCANLGYKVSVQEWGEMICGVQSCSTVACGPSDRSNESYLTINILNDKDPAFLICELKQFFPPYISVLIFSEGVLYYDNSPVKTVPSSVNLWRPVYHYTPPSEWMNDLQRPLYVNGKMYGWYLWNKDYPSGNGTEWRQIVYNNSWVDTGVISLPKYQQGQGDPWTGSTVIDTHNTAGFGAGAIIAIVTMAADAEGGQTTFLWHTSDITQPFTYYGPVMVNPHANDNSISDKIFRDPSVFWDDARGRWVMTLAEIGKISIYTSPDLKTWSYASGGLFTTNQDLGTMECPNLFQLEDMWVMTIGGNGYKTGHTSGTYCWIGTFDGTTFTPLYDPQRLDDGPDFYAAATWFDPVTNQRCIYGWMNNWDYAGNCPTEGFYGNISITRTLSLSADKKKVLMKPLVNQFLTYDDYGSQTITGNSPYKFGNIYSPNYIMDINITKAGNSWPTTSTISVHKSSDGKEKTDIIIDYQNKLVILRRSNSGVIVKNDSTWLSDYQSSVDLTDLSMKIFVDRSTVEIFINDGEASISSLVFPSEGSDNISFISDGAVTAQVVMRGV